MNRVQVVLVSFLIFTTFCASFAQADDDFGKLTLTKVEERAGTGGNKISIFTHKAVKGLDSPGYVAAGYEYHVTLSVPQGINLGNKKLFPLVMILHGFGDKWNEIVNYANAYPNMFVLLPSDPLGTWFYGYSDQLPKGDPNKGTVVNYTERRVINYFWHFEEQYPIDRNRIFVMGGSMGGTGTISLALRYPNIFASGDARKGATNRLYCHWKNQCETIWGSAATGVKNNDGINVWDWQNMAWYASKHHKDSTWLRTLKGREDASIPFRQLAGPPGVQPMSFYQAMETFKIGHQCIWDGSSHTKMPDPPFVADDWWDPFTDPVCFLRLDLSFPAFTHFSADNNPGTGAGDCVGPDTQLGDNTYDCDPQGGFNRFLRWNSTTIVDQPGEYAIELKLSAGKNGYQGKTPATVDVTPRRLQKFAVAPKAKFHWTTSTGQSGDAAADAEGLLTIPAVKLATQWTKLTIKPAK